MSIPSDLLASESITFEGAIALTQSLLSEIEDDRLSQTEIEQAVASLVKTQNGARGFFVTYLTDDRPMADQPSPGVLDALREDPEIVAELLVKNLAMSAAMVVHHFAPPKGEYVVEDGGGLWEGAGAIAPSNSNSANACLSNSSGANAGKFKEWRGRIRGVFPAVGLRWGAKSGDRFGIAGGDRIIKEVGQRMYGM